MGKKRRIRPGHLVDFQGRIAAGNAGCIGFTERDMDRAVFAQCPCLKIAVVRPSPLHVLETTIQIIKYVSENKLSELYTKLKKARVLLAAPKLAGQGTNVAKSSLYDRNAEFRARLLALIRYLKSIRRYEPFNVQFPELPIPAGTPFFELNGPVYMLMQTHGNVIIGHIIFPSMTKDGQPFVSYDNLAKSHRWVDRIISNPLYVGGAVCKKECKNTLVVNRQAPFCGTWAPKKQPKIDNFGVFQLNLNYPPIASYFKNSRIKSMNYSLLPSDWEMYAGSKNLISTNKNYYLTLHGNFLAVFKKAGGRLKYVRGIKFAGIARKAVIENGELTIYGYSNSPDVDEPGESILWQKQISEGGVQPFTLHLGDDGKLSVFDGDNKNVIVSDFESTFDTSDEDAEFILKEYDPTADYQRRLWAWLWYLWTNRIVRKIILPDNANLLKRLNITYDDFVPTKPFDPMVDYQGRLHGLFRTLKTKYPGIVLPNKAKMLGVMPKVDLTYENETISTVYDPAVDLTARIAYLRSRLWKKQK